VTLHCHVCGEREPPREKATLCNGCWWRLYRILSKTPAERRVAREDADLDYACHLVLDNPPRDIAAFVARVLAHRHHRRPAPIAPGQ
jgi:hypothetical protein